MRLLRFVPLLALPFLFLGATCVTKVEQKGPTGPWVGEVTNTGADVGRFSVAAQIVGSDGHEVYSPSVSTCPPLLSPGQVGTFELAIPAQILSYPTTELPLSLASPPMASSDQPSPDTSVTPSGLSARLVQKYPGHDALIAEIANDSGNDYAPISVCANIRDSSGHILAVGTGDLFPSFLGPQESHDVVVRFSSLPEGTLEYFVSASLNSGLTQALDPSALKVSTTRVVQTDHGRFLFLGATCVTKVEQKGPTGPWVGEVTNTGSDPQIDVRVKTVVVDSSGKPRWGGSRAETCPFDLLPGQKGYFIQDALSLPATSDASPPLQLSSVDAYSCESGPLTNGVTFGVVKKLPDHNSVLVEMRNNSASTYYDVDICGLLFDESGNVQDIAAARPFPAAMLKPNEAVTFPITFDTAIDGRIQFAARSAFATHDDVELDASHFEITASKVVQTDKRRELQVVGEVVNDSAVDLDDAQYEVYLDSDPTVRATGWVGSIIIFGPAGGTGFIPAGGRTPVVFSLPLKDGDSTQVKSAGIIAHTSQLPTATRIPVTGAQVDWTQPGVGWVQGTLTNPFDTRAQVFFCIELKGSRGQVIGAACRDASTVDAHESFAISRTIDEVAPAESFEVFAYARPGCSCVIVGPSDPGPSNDCSR